MWEQPVLWAPLRFGLTAAAEFAMCEAPSVQHLAGDLSLALIFLTEFSLPREKGKSKILINGDIHTYGETA